VVTPYGEKVGKKPEKTKDKIPCVQSQWLEMLDESPKNRCRKVAPKAIAGSVHLSCQRERTVTGYGPKLKNRYCLRHVFEGQYGREFIEIRGGNIKGTPQWGLKRPGRKVFPDLSYARVQGPKKLGGKET